MGVGGRGGAGHSKLFKTLSFNGKTAAAGAERLPGCSQQHGDMCFAAEVVSLFRRFNLEPDQDSIDQGILRSFIVL